jgi:osmotically-inducible protein OsmY
LALIVLVGLLWAAASYWKLGPDALDPRRWGVVGERIQDTKTTAAVRTALALNRGLAGYDLEASVENGVATLRGVLPGEEQKAQALRVAAAVPEVRQVVDQMRVDPQARPQKSDDERSVGERVDDEKLAVQVRLALSLNRELRSAAIEVDAVRREVTLSGRVESDAQRRAALETAGQTRDVARVIDRLQGAPPPPAADARSVEQALAANPNLAPYHLTVRLAGDGLVLEGRVRTGAERELAGLLAQQAGGGPIKNALVVEP